MTENLHILLVRRRFGLRKVPPHYFAIRIFSHFICIVKSSHMHIKMRIRCKSLRQPQRVRVCFVIWSCHDYAGMPYAHACSKACTCRTCRFAMHAQFASSYMSAICYATCAHVICRKSSVQRPMRPPHVPTMPLSHSARAPNSCARHPCSTPRQSSPCRAALIRRAHA